ncbi:photosystem I assembly protein Ycf3 [Vibrio aerogenes CECT 7868]|uniref:Photosystem I assembly protein Ycf3 n=1 Tax=Vibrio aerogenes CECT 7868 TaxID=1216006 RepID=A0A1M5XUV1_9VIBR|nr:type IV pilus biogenesis/stability protein PilW [Vibrio aerogenes]SHI03318.1 photosystem I assembly protein Ycf3 [Vibrio aerogenes CECT 7868]
MKKSILLSLCLLCSCTTTHQSKQTEISTADARISLGVAYLQNNQREHARSNLLKAEKAAPEYIGTLMAMAYYYDFIGEMTQASQTYLQALSIYPKQPDLLNNYGTFLCKHGHYKAALNYFQKAYIQTDYIKVADSLENAGLCAFRAGKISMAQKMFKQAISYEPDKKVSHFYLIYIENGKRGTHD